MFPLLSHLALWYLSVQGRRVDMKGFGGTTMSMVDRMVSRMGPRLGCYSVVVLSRCTPETVASDLIHLTRVLVNTFGVPKIVCQLIRKRSTSHFRGIGLGDYNAVIDRSQ